jgi:hypothetical protein
MKMISKKDINKLLEGGLVTIDKDGELSLTEQGQNDAMKIAKQSPEYMKQIAKRFEGETVTKESVNIKDLREEIEKVDNIKLGIYERYNIAENDSLKNYQLFCKLVEKSPNLDSDAMFGLMKQSKHFEIPDNINLMLQNTSNEIKRVRMPHYIMFLDFSIVVYDRVFHSMLIVDLLTIAEKLKRKDLPKEIQFTSFYSDEEGIGMIKTDLLKPSKNKYVKKLQEYIMNFVDFVNNEEVKLMFKERTERNTERRVKKGKLPLPSFNKIYVVGYLAKYLKQLESNELQTRFSHRFWVRGHFRRYLNKEIYSKLYEKYKKGELKNFEGKQYKVEDGFLREWIYPYIKGEGMLIESKYKLK